MTKHMAALERWFAEITRRQAPRGVFSLEGVLFMLSFLYRMALWCRTLLYDRGVLPCHRVSCRVISFGNIVAGGSGKTPMVMAAAALLKGMGLQPVVISRGYLGTAGKKGAVAGDGTHCFLDAAAAGDEPVMMARQGVCPVIVDRDRVRGARRAIGQFRPDVILLDDGFQHRRLHRDLDLVLMDAAAPLGNGRLLPAGRLRESPGAVAGRAHAVIYTRCTARGPVHGPWERRKPVFLTAHQPVLRQYIRAGAPPDPVPGSLAMLQGRRVLVVSAIADNRGFCQSVAALGMTVQDHIFFRDHHGFTPREIRQIHHRAAALGAEVVVTTEKDHARLPASQGWPVDRAVLGVDIGFCDPRDQTRFQGLLWPGPRPVSGQKRGGRNG